MTTTIVVIIGAFSLLVIGTLVGRYYVPDDRGLRRSARHAEAYIRALTHLLQRDDDAAIAELRGVVADNVVSVEPYFALASLFRSRGEWERAIRVHQAIAVRKDTCRADKLRARYQLGLDFRSAGMPRRATRAFEECLEQSPNHLGALRALCGLYEEQGNYVGAASSWRQLAKVGGENTGREVHLWAAAAQRAANDGDLDGAQKALKAARKLSANDPHVWMAAAEVAAARGNPTEAAACLRAALMAQPSWASYLVPQLLETELARTREQEGTEEARTHIARDTTLTVLESMATGNAGDSGNSGNNPHLMLAVAELRSHLDIDAAMADFRRIATLYPALLPARVASARLALAGQDSGEISAELISLVGAEGALAWAVNGRWQCTHCRKRHRQFFWRCSTCRQWGSVAPDIGDENNRAPGNRDRRGRPRQTASALPMQTPSVDT